MSFLLVCLFPVDNKRFRNTEQMGFAKLKPLHRWIKELKEFPIRLSNEEIAPKSDEILINVIQLLQISSL